MQSVNRAVHSRALFILATLFISCYFILFSYDSFNTYFCFDDGMALISMHHVWEFPFRANLLEVLTVFTPAFRPLGALVYRPLYALFGFNPLPFRIVAWFLLS